MKEKIYAFSENFANEYINMRALVTPEERKQAFMLFAEDTREEPIDFENGENAIIKIHGPLSQSGPDVIDKWLGYGGTKYGDIIAACKKYKKSASVNNVYIEYNTGGGEVSGCLEAAQAIRELRQAKNVVTVNTRMMASAGYWLGSQGSKVYGSNPIVETGSIGVVWVIADYDRGMEDKEYGMARVRITSKNAKNKRPDITDPKDRQWMQDIIDGMERIMIADIAKGRGIAAQDIIDNYGQGAMFIAQDPSSEAKDAIKIGMLDGVIEYNPDEILSNSNSTNPAMRDNITEVKVMSLKEMLDQNPAAKIEYENALKEAKTAGYEKGKADMIEISSKAAVFASSKEYPEQVKAIALEVMQGKKSAEALDSIVATADMIKQMTASNVAQGEQVTESGNGQQEIPLSNDGTISSFADLKAEAARLKGVN